MRIGGCTGGDAQGVDREIVIIKGGVTVIPFLQGSIIRTLFHTCYNLDT